MHTKCQITQDYEEGGEVLAAAEVTMHRARIRMGVANEVANLAQLKIKPVYLDSPEVAVLFGINKGRQRVTLLKGALQKTRWL